RRDINA
ncbi:hypothetical protein ACTFIW_008870, partial [Dictyostelium discoideum]